jgi:hypothetical protein
MELKNPTPPILTGTGIAGVGRPFSFHVRRLFACNPFYLLSVALLLLGLFLVSADSNFPGRETAQLTLNFSALQCYELLLAVTAILLARRRVWYDSMLLVWLENLLVPVPLVLLTQAAWIDEPVLRAMCVAASVMAIVRFAGLKRFFAELNLPAALLAVGALVLCVNVGLTLAYHHYNELKVGTKTTTGAAYELNEYGWLALLPALVALGSFVPCARFKGDLIPQHGLLPAGFFGLWIAATCVHLCCLGYVYNFDWTLAWAAPALWSLAWTVQFKASRLFAETWLVRSLLIGPALVTLLPTMESANRMFAALTALNIVIYLAVFARRRTDWLALNLAIVSFGALGWGLMAEYQPALPIADAGFRVPLALSAIYAGFWIFRTRNPKLGFLGGVMAAIVCGMVVGDQISCAALPIQTGLVFLLLHSMRWRDEDDRSGKTARMLGCLLWVGDSAFVILAPLPHARLIISCAGALVLGAAVAARWRLGTWLTPVLPLAALVVLAMPPVFVAIDWLRTVPGGLVALGGSFLLFGLGTLAALTKSRWHPPVARTPAAPAGSIS